MSNVVHRNSKPLINPNSVDGNVVIGEVGYKFRKFFKGFGYFDGMVVEIRDGAANGKDRRCVYSDGDKEDLSLKQLWALSKIQNERIVTKDNNNSVKRRNVKRNHINCDKHRKRKHKQITRYKDQIQNTEGSSIRNIFASAGELLPVDRAVEATFESQISQSDLSLQDNMNSKEWLTKVATLLVPQDKSLSQNRSKKFESTHAKQLLQKCESQVTVQSCDQQSNERKADCSHEFINRNQPAIPSSSSSLSLEEEIVMLSDIKVGERHGTIVYLANDREKNVGEVILEIKNGWVEIFFSCRTKKERASKCVVYQNQSTAKYVSNSEISTEISIRSVDSCSIHNSYDSSLLERKKSSASSTCSSSLGTTKSRSTNVETFISLDSLFYWWCIGCKMANKHAHAACSECKLEKTTTPVLSALSSIANDAIIASSTIEEAMKLIPNIHILAIPYSTLSWIFRMNDSNSGKAIQCPSSRTVDEYFYWFCASCAVSNSYRRVNCTVCGDGRNAASSYSKLFEIALEAANGACTHAEATDNIPNIHVPAIPEIIMKSFFTDGTQYTDQTITSSDRPKRLYCQTNKPSLNYQNEWMQTNTITGFTSLRNDVLKYLRVKVSSQLNNRLNWNTKCIEDSILCEKNCPFPLGMVVRRFFPRYGFHDGRIVKINRRCVEDEEVNTTRPVLVYGVLYDDGDFEELIHHEINSLCQIYDRHNIEATAPFQMQLAPGTIYETYLGIVHIIEHCGAQSNMSNAGIVSIKFREIGKHWIDLVIELTDLQLTVIRKISLGDTITSDFSGKSCLSKGSYPKTMECIKSPILEWPAKDKNYFEEVKEKINIADIPLDVTKNEAFMVLSNLWLYQDPVPKVSKKIEVSRFMAFHGRESLEKECCIVDDPTCTRPGVSDELFGWDPAGGLDYIEWNPFKAIVCEVCHMDVDEHLVLICDNCDRGYHMYCVRPVIVSVPEGDWLCSECIKSNVSSFHDILNKLDNDSIQVSNFLDFPFDQPEKFCIMHKKELEMFASRKCSSKRAALFSPSRTKSSTKVGCRLFFSRNVDKNSWLLPLPLSDEKLFPRSLTTIVAAMKYCGMTRYSDELVYAADVNETMNDVRLDNIGPLSQKNLEIYKQYKENIRMGAFPPIRIVYDDKIGLTVEALAVIPMHTIITEYVGEVTTMEKSYNTSSDSLMVLLETGDPKTSLIIDPTKIGNFARFLNGINNRIHSRKMNAQVRTRRFAYEGKCHVVLFTAKRVEPGDVLHYDYNAGIKGKTVKEWATSGFYDTSNFL